MIGQAIRFLVANGCWSWLWPAPSPWAGSSPTGTSSSTCSRTPPLPWSRSIRRPTAWPPRRWNSWCPSRWRPPCSASPRWSESGARSTYGLSVVNVYFEEGTDIYWARQVLAPRLHEIEADLPPQAHESFLGPIATGLGMVYMYYLEGEGYSAMELRTLQDWLVKYELKSVPEVSQVLTIGGDVQQFQVLVDPNALLQFDLTLSDIMDRIEAGNRNAAAGFITRGPEEFIVRSLGLVETVEDLRNIVVAHRGGTPVYLSSVAQVELLPGHQARGRPGQRQG